MTRIGRVGLFALAALALSAAALLLRGESQSTAPVNVRAAIAVEPVREGVSRAAPPATTAPTSDGPQPSPPDPRRALLGRMARELDLAPEAVARTWRIFERSAVLGQGNPALSVHPVSVEECRQIRLRAGLAAARSAVCGAWNMVPLYDPTSGQTADDARVCIDQFEFPNLPCEYPLVHVTAREAVELCEALGKRLCDAHEWEGACAGALRPPEVEYAWGKSRAEMRARHNATRERVWAYGPQKAHDKCATGSDKSPGCTGGGYRRCGSNTYPAGAFPQCVSRFGVYDLHGNVAEHMSLPLKASELGSRSGHGWTEMKGSWFVFGKRDAHEDDCRWRAPDWHGSRTTDRKSHSNYHLGFRCCRDVTPSKG